MSYTTAEEREKRMGMAAMELSTEFMRWADGRNLCDTPTDEVFRLCSVISQLRARIAELEAARAKTMEGANPLVTEALEEMRKGVTSNGWMRLVVEEVDRRGDLIVAQSAELERLRSAIERVRTIRENWAGTNEAIDLELGEALAGLDHAVTAQTEPQAEFHAIGNPPPEVMALVQREYKRMVADKDGAK